MQAMTPEQEEQWKEAVLPLASYLVGDEWQAERSLAALLPIEERTKRFAPMLEEGSLTVWGVPSWEWELRHAMLIWRPDHIIEPWIASFVLRSETALVGIQIVTTSELDQEAMYQRIFVRFVQEALHPFVEWARQAKDARRSGYEPLVLLYDYCKNFTPPANLEQWPDLLRYLGGDNRDERYEANSAFALAKTLRQAILARLNLKSLPSNESFRSFADQLLFTLNFQNQWFLTDKVRAGYDEGPNYTETIAVAYLTALESECPPPDWLPRI